MSNPTSHLFVLETEGTDHFSCNGTVYKVRRAKQECHGKEISCQEGRVDPSSERVLVLGASDGCVGFDMAAMYAESHFLFHGSHVEQPITTEITDLARCE